MTTNEAINTLDELRRIVGKASAQAAYLAHDVRRHGSLPGSWAMYFDGVSESLADDERLLSDNVTELKALMNEQKT